MYHNSKNELELIYSIKEKNLKSLYLSINLKI